jgi:hypothetical protein
LGNAHKHRQGDILGDAVCVEGCGIQLSLKLAGEIDLCDREQPAGSDSAQEIVWGEAPEGWLTVTRFLEREDLVNMMLSQG